MARSDNQGQRVAFHFPDGQRGIINLAFNEAKVRVSSIHRLGNVLGICHCHVQIDTRISLPKSFGACWEPIVCNGLARSQDQRATLEASQIVQDPRRGLGARYDLACLIEEISAGLGQYDPAADTVE